MENKIYVLGVGHNTPVMLDLAISCGYNIVGLYHYNDDRTGDIDHGFTILGSFTDLWEMNDLSGMNFLLSMGDIRTREEVFQKILSKGGSLPTLIHPSAVISTFAKISPVAVCVFPFTFIESDATIGSNTIILSHVNISHNSIVGNNCFIAGGAIVGAYATVEDNVFIGQGALLISGKVNSIGTHSFIGAGSLVTRSVAPYTMVAGFPARKNRELDE